jgi:hypothetical protein
MEKLVAAHRIAESGFRRLLLAASSLSIALVFLLGASAAQALTVLCGATECGPGDTNATGILNLDFPGGDPLGYNVEFLFASAEDIWGSPAIVFDFNTAIPAIAASVALSAALNTKPEVVTVGPNMEDRSRIPYEPLIGDNLLTDDQVYEMTGGMWDSEGGTWSDSDTLTYAKFNVVPEPGTGALLGLGLMGLGVASHRRREESRRTA